MFISLLRRTLLLGAVIVISAGSNARAGQAFTLSGEVNPAAAGAAATFGFMFTLTQTIRVTDLGVYDSQWAWSGSRDVGLWDVTSTPSLLASTSVAAPPSAPSSGTFLYTPIAPVSIGPGVYVVAATTLAGDRPGVNGTRLFDPLIGYSSSLTAPGTTGLTLPTTLFPSAPLVSWANFQFTTEAAAVPEPSTLAGAAMAIGMILGVRSIRSRRMS